VETSKKLLENLDSANTDKELFDAASQIVCSPKKPGDGESDSSFILHSPLEICARYFLLPLVDDEHVQGARKQIRLTAMKYMAFENVDTPSARSSYPDFKAEDIDVNKWSTSLLFASHAPILLAKSNALGETNGSIDSVLWNMGNKISEIAESSDSQMAWTKEVLSAEVVSPDLLKHPQHWFIQHVGNISHVDGPSGSIRGGVEAVESSRNILPLIETIGAIANFSDRADFEMPFKALLRVAALSMLIENGTNSKYGWTHCVTIPHAIWSLASSATRKGEMLQAATTHVATFRALMGDIKMVADQLDEYLEQDEHSIFAEHHVQMTDIISQSCILEDAHLVKYAYSCFDLMKRDPQYSKLYIAAAGKLLNIWHS